MIKDRLNDFETDWAAMPQVEKEKLEKLKGKTVLVCGHTIARCLCYALVYQSERKSRNIKVIYAGDCTDFYPECTDSEFFTAVNLNSIREIKDADYIVHTGFCGEYSESYAADFAEEISSVNALAALAEKTNAKVVLLSDSRVYGNGKPMRVYSENENAPICNSRRIFAHRVPYGNRAGCAQRAKNLPR